MKKNEKGFTLIELLAVIVILAIIALITTPIVLNVISTARLDAAKNKMYGVIDAVRLAYTQNQVSTNPVAATGGKITIQATDTSLGNTPISISGDKPTAGTVIIDVESGKIYTGTDVQFDGYKCHVPESDSGSEKAGEAYCEQG